MGETYPLYVSEDKRVVFDKFKKAHPRNVSKVILGLVECHMENNPDLYESRNPRGGDWN